MSASSTQSSDYGIDTPDGISAPLPPEFALRLLREPPSTGLPDLSPETAPSLGGRNEISHPLPQQPLTPIASSLSKTSSPSDIRSQSHDRSSISSRGTSPSFPLDSINQGNREIIVRSFAPRVAVYASTDVEDFIKGKGFQGGLYDLLRPFGERLQGKVIIRDSIGSSKAWDNFGIRFVDSQHLHRSSAYLSATDPLDSDFRGQDDRSQSASKNTRASQDNNSETAIDQILDHSLQAGNGDSLDLDSSTYESRTQSSPLHQTYLRRILSSTRLVPYETFSHPVACMIAVSSRHPAPIEALRQLYSGTVQGSNGTPPWVGTEFLRYYVLIHDEENDDITKSTALFDLMKRHFGLHCHLLRLRSSQCIETDDDSIRIPSCEWLSAGEEMDGIRARDYTDELEILDSYVLESDATAIKALLREMVTQSIVPFMENRVMTWNDQVASRRRGISGRFMSLSKRWTGFGSAKNATIGSAGAPNSSGNYDHQNGFYPPQSPEGTMRQLGDYAFMLRDWKLAYSTYDFIRTEFSHDKAWNYHAAANEMAAISSLLIPQTYSPKYRFELIDQMLDTAAYSYLTRCSMPSNVVRCLTVAMELLSSRGPSAVDDAARWGGRLLELSVLTPFAQALATERVANCYASLEDAPLPGPGSRRRQTALWNVLASGSWIRLDQSACAESRLQAAKALYGLEDNATASLQVTSMHPLFQKLDNALGHTGRDPPAMLIDVGVDEGRPKTGSTEESEQLGQSRPSNYLAYDDVDGEGFTVQDARSSKS